MLLADCRPVAAGSLGDAQHSQTKGSISSGMADVVKIPASIVVASKQQSKNVYIHDLMIRTS
jgi:hypothetical protein